MKQALMSALFPGLWPLSGARGSDGRPFTGTSLLFQTASLKSLCFSGPNICITHPHFHPHSPSSLNSQRQTQGRQLPTFPTL